MTTIEKLGEVARTQRAPNERILRLMIEANEDGSFAVTAFRHAIISGSGPSLEAALVDLLANMGAL